MSTNKQRRESERLRLQRQLEERRRREVARRKTTTILSIVGALVLIAAVIVVVVVATNGSDKKKTAAKAGSSTAAASTTPAATSAAPTSAAAPVPTPTAACSAPQKGSTATFAGLTITGSTDLKKAPKVSGKASGADPASVQCADLVVGTGKVASTSVTAATVEYIGLIAKTGKVFQSSWTSQPATFGLAAGPNGVIAGFSQGIAGAGKIAPMHVGGRRVILMPAVAAYGATPPSGSGIPADASLVFVVDLQKIGS